MSDKSVAAKLGMKAGKTILVLNAQVDIANLLGEIPAGAKWVQKGEGPFPAILQFVLNKAEMMKLVPAAKKHLEPTGALWIAYAKGTSAKATDINRDSIREYANSVGLDTVAQIGLDQDWSALRCKIV
ncbi:MAG: hypothetical protein ABI230_11340 [Aestuariivirga sp.]